MQAAIEDFLRGYGRALSSGDLDAVAAAWETPALVLADQGAIAVAAEEDIRAFFGQAVAWYHAQGMQTTEPSDVRVEVLSDRLLAVDVVWIARGAGGAERSREHSYYIVRLDDEGRPRIRLTASRPAAA